MSSGRSISIDGSQADPVPEICLYCLRLCSFNAGRVDQGDRLHWISTHHILQPQNNRHVNTIDSHHQKNLDNHSFIVNPIIIFYSIHTRNLAYYTSKRNRNWWRTSSTINIIKLLISSFRAISHSESRSQIEWYYLQDGILCYSNGSNSPKVSWRSWVWIYISNYFSIRNPILKFEGG